METKELAKQLGISHQMANRYKMKGMPTDSLESAIAWRKSNVDPFRSKSGRICGNTGVKRGTKTATDTHAIDELKKDVNDCQLDLESTNADELYLNARALKEKAVALQAAAEYSKFIGELVARDHVEKIVFERARQFRDGLSNLSMRLSPELVSLKDVSEIQSLLNKEHRLILEVFAKLPVIEG